MKTLLFVRQTESMFTVVGSFVVVDAVRPGSSCILSNIGFGLGIATEKKHNQSYRYLVTIQRMFRFTYGILLLKHLCVVFLAILALPPN